MATVAVFDETVLQGHRLKQARQSRGLSQAELGKAVGVSAQQISKYESGRDDLSGDRLRALCTALAIEPAQIVGKTEPRRVAEAPEPYGGQHRLMELYRALSPVGQAALLAEAERLAAPERDI